MAAETQVAALHDDVDLLEKSAPNVMADILERHFPCGTSVVREKEPD